MGAISLYEAGAARPRTTNGSPGRSWECHSMGVHETELLSGSAVVARQRKARRRWQVLTHRHPDGLGSLFRLKRAGVGLKLGLEADAQLLA